MAGNSDMKHTQIGTDQFFSASTLAASVSHQRKFSKYYKKGNLIARGAFGEALTVISKQDGMMYIMKQEQFTTTADGKKKRREEIKSLRMCSHNNIVKYFDDFFENFF